MTDYELDVRNYTIYDLEKFLHLKPPYSISDIEFKTAEMQEQLITSGHVDKKMIRNVIHFLKEAEDFLVYYLDPSVRAAYGKPKQPEFSSRVERELIQRPQKTYQMTMPNEYIQSNELNPLKVSTIKKSLLIDTRFRENLYTTQSSNFMFTLPSKLQRVVSMQMTAFELPVAFYSISESYGNNFLYISATYTPTDEDETTVETVLVVPDGNYNASDLIVILNTLLTETDETVFTYVQFLLDVTSTGSGSGKIILSATTDTDSLPDTISSFTSISLDFTLDINGDEDNVSIATKLGWTLGFMQSYYKGETTYTSDSIPDPASIRYVYVIVDDFNNNVNDYFISALNPCATSNKNILARIPIRGSYFSLLMENDLSLYTTPRQYFGPVDITRLKIQLLDDHGRILGMNNSNYSICLSFTIVYD